MFLHCKNGFVQTAICLKHFNLFCQLFLELFVSFKGKLFRHIFE